ncbi:MAG: glutamine synthetase [Atopobiaceae bacterium]|nr:glutamine synthetase [Atopobiaceae bacterium]
MARNQHIDFVLRTVEERDIRFVRLWFTDVMGNLKSFAITPEDLEEAFEEGIGFDGSAVEGFTKLQEADVLAFPDPETFQILPWRPSESGVARMFCQIMTPDFEPFPGDPRACLRRLFEETENKGFIFNVGPEIEYFIFGDSRTPILVDDAGYFDLTPWDSSRELRRETTLMLERMSIPVEYSYHAQAPSQNCIELRFAEGVTCADNVVTARHVIKQTAFANDMFASFMPKPFADKPGSALNLHESLFDMQGNNVFWSEDAGEDGLHLSDIARHYIAGLLKYAPEYMLVTNPTVNSYKRLANGGEVAYSATWGRLNRSAMVRIPTYKPGKTVSTRIELRNPDPTSNTYLAFAVTLAAGMRGVEEELPLQPESTIEDASLSRQELKARGIVQLPRTLGGALSAFERSDLMREVLGDHIYGYLLEAKRREWDEWCSTVTDWERERYYAGF